MQKNANISKRTAIEKIKITVSMKRISYDLLPNITRFERSQQALAYVTSMKGIAYSIH